MAFVKSNNGKLPFLTMALKDAAPLALQIRLFTNNQTPTTSDTILNYSELTTHGYAARDIPRSTWYVSLDSQGNTNAVADNVVFVLDGTGADVTVYGYTITYNIGTQSYLIGAEQFLLPLNLSSAGGTITVTPTITEQ